FFSSRRRHTRSKRDWSSDVCSSDLTAQTIKSHHNVGGLPEDIQFQLIEPLNKLFKDEVRLLGEKLGMPHELVWRQPFPGPGLGRSEERRVGKESRCRCGRA